ncbi:MAG: hypothetical protein ACJA2S_000676 [Cyclobacteriaceae bacterium]|jgi:hypothetical protein
MLYLQVTIQNENLQKDINPTWSLGTTVDNMIQTKTARVDDIVSDLEINTLSV